LAKPGLSGLSSNSWEQTAQVLIGNGIYLHFKLGHPSLLTSLSQRSA
jgi:hypothetical protein